MSAVDSTIVLEAPPIDVLLRTEWEEWGLCTQCGVQTHEIVVPRGGTMISGGNKKRIPLTRPGSVHLGRCLGCCEEASAQVFPELLGGGGEDEDQDQDEVEGVKRGDPAAAPTVDESSCTSIPQVVDVPQGDDDAFKERLAATRETTKKAKSKKKKNGNDDGDDSIGSSIESNSVTRSMDDSSASNGSGSVGHSSSDEDSSDEDSSDDDASASSATYVTGNGSMKKSRRVKRSPLPSIVSLNQPNSSAHPPSRGTIIANDPFSPTICRSRSTPPAKKTTELKRLWSHPARPAWTAKAAIRSHEEELQRMMLEGSPLSHTGAGTSHPEEYGEGLLCAMSSSSAASAVSVGSSGKSSSLLSGVSADSESSGWVAQSNVTRKPTWRPGQSARKIMSLLRGRAVKKEAWASR